MMRILGIILAILLFYSSPIFACPSGQTCPAGKDCISDSSQCVTDSSSSSTTSSGSSSEPTTAKDELGLTFEVTNDGTNAPTLMTGSSCTTCVRFDPQNASVPQPIEK